jgi:hypothetical protein
MIKYLAGVGALALVASPVIAQDQEEPVEGKDNFGTTVRELAQGQRDAETKGIGAEVSEQAKARAEERRAARGEDDDDDDADEAAATATEDSEEDAVTGRANAAEGSAAALAEKVAAGRGDNAGVKDNTGAVAELRAARSGREFGAEARAAAADARAAAADGRQIAADARAAATQAREQAQTIRDTVRNARPGRGG